MSLLFVDTNIWLDFYRSRNDAGLSLLKHLDQIRDQLIVTYQVEMEFKKNRQAVILGSVKELKEPQAISRPAIFSDAKVAVALNKDLAKIKSRLSSMRVKLQRLLQNPAQYDPVYQVFHRCFHSEDTLSLTRKKKERHQIKRRAFRRFICGYPPRKQNDTSIGDAINWEWIIDCATKRSEDIHIVSRDSDYGLEFDGHSYLNDHLLQEFKERVGIRRKIFLHTQISQVLKKHFKIDVTQSQEEAEKEIALRSEADDDERILTKEEVSALFSAMRDRIAKDRRAMEATRPVDTSAIKLKGFSL